jgi:hypothetical protein
MFNTPEAFGTGKITTEMVLTSVPELMVKLVLMVLVVRLGDSKVTGTSRVWPGFSVPVVEFTFNSEPAAPRLIV